MLILSYLIYLFIYLCTFFLSAKALINKKMANNNNSNTVLQFVKAVGSDAIPRMARMLLVDKTISDINIKDSGGWTALLYQARCGTTGNMAWLLRQDPPADIDVRNPIQQTPLMAAALSNTDSEGKVRLLIEHGANRDLVNEYGHTALSIARRFNENPAAVIDLLENYRPDVSR